MIAFRRLTLRIAVLAIAVMLLASPSLQAQQATPFPYVPGTDLSTLKGKISADGSSTVFPIMEALAEEFNAEAGKVNMTLDVSGTGGGFKRFCKDEIDIANASRAMKPEEVAACLANGVSYYVFEIAYDGISIVINPDNDWVDCLTTAQLRQIWEPDSGVHKWSDINPAWPNKTITLYGPGTDSGTYDFFTKAINGEEGVSRDDYNPSEDDNVLVQGVSGDKGAMAFFGYSFYEENADSLKLLGIDNGSGCVQPSTQTVQDGTYAPLSRPLYLYVTAKAMTRPEVQEFMRFAIPEVGLLISDVGFIGSPGQIYVEDQIRIEQIIAGHATPDGPGANATPGA